MANIANLKLLNAIKIQLDLLEDAFYDGIPNELLRNPHISHFSHMMEVMHSKIIILVKNSISTDGDNADNDIVDDNMIEKSEKIIEQNAEHNIEFNINYSQLEALSKKDKIY